MKFLLSFIIFLFYSLLTTAQVCDTLHTYGTETGENDVAVWSPQPNSNFKNHNEMYACAWTYGGDLALYRGLIKFPLPTMPASYIIDSATLYFYYNNTSSNYGHSFYPSSPYPLQNEAMIHRIIQNWDVNTVTWNNQPLFTNLNAVSIPITSTQTQNLKLDVTQLINDTYLNPSSSFGFMFKLVDEAYYRSQLYASSNHANPALHPKLVICYRNTTKIKEVLEKNNFEVYSDNFGKLVLKNEQSYFIKSLKIFNISGSSINEIKLNNNLQNQSISFPQNNANGIYFIQIKTNEGVVVKKVVIK